jgi:hypothetical protein
MLSSSLSDVRQTKVYDISFRVPAIREGALSASRSLGQKIKLLLTTKSQCRPATTTRQIPAAVTKLQRTIRKINNIADEDARPRDRRPTRARTSQVTRTC